MADQEKTSTGADQQQVLQQAVKLQQQGRIDEAIDAYQKVLEENPENPDALHFLGMACAARGDYDQAIGLIHQALNVAPEYVDALNNLGVIFQTTGRLEGAEHCYRKVIEIRPGHSDSHNNLGIVLKNQSKLSEAIAAFKEVLALDPNHAPAHHNLGNLCRRAGQDEEAVAHFRAAIDCGFESSEARQALITAHSRAGNREGALGALKDWLEADPENPIAQHMQAAFEGDEVPSRASDEFVSTVFDGMADTFDTHLGSIGYCGPELVIRSLQAGLDSGAAALSILDAGCGTGLCGPLVKPLAKQLAGVDLSKKMLQKAQLLGVYDDLYMGELTAFLQNTPDTWDIIICADTLCYFGELADVSKAAATALKPGGLCVFTVEHLDEDRSDGYLLQENGRYSHTRDYVNSVLTDAGLTVPSVEREVLRREVGKDVYGLVVRAMLPHS